MPILYIITYFALGDKELFLSSEIGQFLGVFLYGILSSIFISIKAQTPGKKAYGIRVVNNDGTNISLLKAFLRFWLFLFSSMILVGVLLSIFRKDKKALHDLLLGTKVILEAD